MTARVLVTGATGLIGAQTLEPLRARGFAVCGVARRPPLCPEIPHAILDLRDVPRVEAMLQALRPTHVLHCAWDVTHGRFWQAPENLDWVAATLALARAAQRCGARRFVGIGTCVEYDWSDALTAPRRETDPIGPTTLYGRSKDCTRGLLEALFREAGISFAWARVFDLFGPGEAPGRLVASALAALRAGLPFTCRHGHLVRDYMAAADVGAALACLVASEVGGAVNIASGSAVSLGQLVRAVGDCLGRPDLLSVMLADAAGQPAAMRADVTRLRREAGAPPPKPLHVRLEEYVAAVGGAGGW